MVQTKVYIGTRGSQLARLQTQYVIDLLKTNHSDIIYETVIIDATADKDQLYSIFSRTNINIFTKELENSLMLSKVDFVVHSCKDLASFMDARLAIGAIVKREDPRDVVIMKKDSVYKKISELPPGAVLGTSSIRRMSQLKKCHPHLNFMPIRGNVNTRLRKLDTQSNYDCLVLAAAGLHRLSLTDRITEYLDSKTCMFAPGQGALAVQCRFEDKSMLNMLRDICDFNATAQIIAERSLFKYLNSGCVSPLGVHFVDVDNTVNLRASVVSLDGQIYAECEHRYDIKNRTEEKNKTTDVVIEEDSKMFTGVYIHDMDRASMLSAQQCGERLSGLLVHKGAKRIICDAIKQSQNI
ncbi:hypothetical protein A3Q56_03262 [Intoshia linei]|uniref:hydroxymethylbilane synthase n=1 Tax=Intoshia linei TaxID=1819745 RepID=A0A177B407_9BILA|nr:hypothetical protein A3Q56_03262 [Intoshia linei]